jgi:hypothetical protein
VGGLDVLAPEHDVLEALHAKVPVEARLLLALGSDFRPA